MTISADAILALQAQLADAGDDDEDMESLAARRVELMAELAATNERLRAAVLEANKTMRVAVIAQTLGVSRQTVYSIIEKGASVSQTA